MVEEKRGATVGEPRRRLTAEQRARRSQRQLPDFTRLDPAQGYEWPVPQKKEKSQGTAGRER